MLPVIFADDSLIELAKAAEVEVWVYGEMTDLDRERLIASGVRGLIVDE